MRLTRGYRPMTIDEAKACGGHLPFIAKDGIVRTLTVTSAPRTWKRNPFRVEVAGKYGPYDYATFCASHAGDRVAVPGVPTMYLLVRDDLLVHDDRLGVTA